jgi:DHA1 family multidrug resistance protein-like MFS transporter
MDMKTAIKKTSEKAATLLRVETFLLLFSLTLALVVFGDSLYSSFMSLFFQEFGIPLGEIGLFFTVFSLTNALVSIPAGYISDRMGRKILISCSLFFLAAVVLGYSLAETAAQLLTLRALHGASFGFIFPIARAYVMDKTTEENRGQTMGAFIFIVSLAQMVAPTTGGILRDQLGRFHPLFYLSAVLAVGAGVFLLIAVKDFGTGFSMQKMRLPTRELFKNRVFTVILLMFGMLFLGGGIVGPFVSIFAMEELGMSYTSLGTLFSIYSIIYAVSQLVAGTLSDRYGRKTLLVYPLFIYVAGILLSGLSPHQWMFIFMYLCVAVGAGPYSTVAYSLIGDRVKPELRGTANGAITTVQNCGLIIGPLVGSRIVDVTNVRVPFVATAAVACATIAVLFILLPKGKDQ